ncbi:hypothetical protein NZK35_20475 [Stieleria sp. ICT_E10.1]|uniref:hypothetical protein n=1 Tax=Stieleria sedimenti TaxID=2976331 RepID=UPI00217F3813|nr:hypothetical protein [Stieleria sedimenti]MCS7469035.1 hypothetical protein [Stieleria sedimenti]
MPWHAGCVCRIGMNVSSIDRLISPPRAAGARFLLLSFIGVSLLGLAGCSPPALFENESGAFVPRIDSDAVIPRGMRRTKNGWEDASLWHVSTEFQSRSIQCWLDIQRHREPHWLRKFFERIRTTPPLMIAVIQITAIAAIVHISQAHKAEPVSNSAKTSSQPLP